MPKHARKQGEIKFGSRIAWDHKNATPSLPPVGSGLLALLKPGLTDKQYARLTSDTLDEDWADGLNFCVGCGDICDDPLRDSTEYCSHYCESRAEEEKSKAPIGDTSRPPFCKYPNRHKLAAAFARMGVEVPGPTSPSETPSSSPAWGVPAAPTMATDEAGTEKDRDFLMSESSIKDIQPAGKPSLGNDAATVDFSELEWDDGDLNWKDIEEPRFRYPGFDFDIDEGLSNLDD